MLQLRSDYTQVMDEISMSPRTSQVQNVNSIMMENIIDRIGITVDHASIRLVNERAIPPVAKKAVKSQPGRRVQLELIQHFVEMGELILLLVMGSSMFMEPSEDMC
jgi:hypothetical protein